MNKKIPRLNLNHQCPSIHSFIHCSISQNQGRRPDQTLIGGQYESIKSVTNKSIFFTLIIIIIPIICTPNM